MVNKIPNSKKNILTHNKYKKDLNSQIFQNNKTINISAKNFEFKENKKSSNHLNKNDLYRHHLDKQSNININQYSKKKNEKVLINPKKTKYINYNPINKIENMNLFIITTSRNIFDGKNICKYLKSNKSDKNNIKFKKYKKN